VRYLFRGLRQQTGEPVDGRVTAPTEEVARNVLRDDGIVADSLQPEPAADEDAAATVTESRFAHALERALDDAGFCVNFDLVTGRYQGKSVCLLDQDKIRKRVMELVDEAVADNLGDDENHLDARRHVAMSLAVRRPGPGQPRRTVPGQTAPDRTHDEILVEVFQSNLELIRGLEEPVSPPATGGEQAASRLA